MPHKYCKPILFGLLTSVSVIICVNARPGPVANDNAQSVEISNNKFDSVQMLNGNGYFGFSRITPAQMISTARRHNDARLMNADTVSADLAESRKISLIATSANETVADVECRSESKPLFFKNILNRLRSPEVLPLLGRSPSSSIHHQSQQHHHPRQHSSNLACRAQSNALHLNNADPAPPIFQYLRRDKQFLPKHDLDLDLDLDLDHDHDRNRDRDRDLDPQHEASSSSSYRYDLAPAASFQTASAAVWPLIFDQTSPIRNNDDYSHTFHSTNVFPPNFVLYPYPLRSRDHATSDIDRPTNTVISANTISSTDETFSKIVDHRPTSSEPNIVVEAKNESSARLGVSSSTSSPSPPLTRIILRPQANAAAGKQGIAISSPISTAYVKRGDYVEIEYLPEAKANVGEGGVAISRPELVIHFVDKRK